MSQAPAKTSGRKAAGRQDELEERTRSEAVAAARAMSAALSGVEKAVVGLGSAASRLSKVHAAMRRGELARHRMAARARAEESVRVLTGTAIGLARLLRAARSEAGKPVPVRQDGISSVSEALDKVEAAASLLAEAASALASAAPPGLAPSPGARRLIEASSAAVSALDRGVRRWRSFSTAAFEALGEDLSSPAGFE